MVEALKGQLRYTGQVQPQPGEVDKQGLSLEPYLPSEELVEAVNLAILLERPLLLKGEPGCGKTRLARAVAYELGLPFESWSIKSTSLAQNGLYTYDTVGRLRDAQLAATGRLKSRKELKRIDDPRNYVQWKPLGCAFRNSQRTVVLIDEIDKADIDFPNDLLLELDEQRFVVEETGEEIRAHVAPIILITSNDEKDLPDAFLRRCLFHYVEFPGHDRLVMIVKSLFPEISEELVNEATKRFMKLRNEMYEDYGRRRKKVTTSELIDWFKVLQFYPEDEILAKLEGKLPFASVLLKNWEDHQRYLK